MLEHYMLPLLVPMMIGEAMFPAQHNRVISRIAYQSWLVVALVKLSLDKGKRCPH